MLVNFIMSVNDNIDKFEIDNDPDIWVGGMDAVYWSNEGELKCNKSKMTRVDTKADGSLVCRSYMPNGDVLISKTPIAGAVKTERMLNSNSGVVCLVNKDTNKEVFYYRHKSGYICHTKQVSDLDYYAAAMVG